MEAEKTDLEMQLRASLSGKTRQRGRLVDAAAKAPTAIEAPGRRRASVAKTRECANDAEPKESAYRSDTPVADRKWHLGSA